MLRRKNDVRFPKIGFPMSDIFLLTTRYGVVEAKNDLCSPKVESPMSDMFSPNDVRSPKIGSLISDIVPTKPEQRFVRWGA